MSFDQDLSDRLASGVRRLEASALLEAVGGQFCENKWVPQLWEHAERHMGVYENQGTPKLDREIVGFP